MIQRNPQSIHKKTREPVPISTLVLLSSLVGIIALASGLMILAPLQGKIQNQK